MSDDPLKTQIQFVTGVGPARAQLLSKIHLETVEDVLWNIPRGILDLTEVRPVPELEEGELQTVRGTVADIDGRNLSRGRTMSAVLLDCDGTNLRGVWFNQNWVLRKFQLGDTVLFSGKPKRRNGQWEMSHPRIQWLEADDADSHGGILPKYGLTDGLKMHEMRRISQNVVDEFAELVPEHLPADFLETHRLPSLKQAVRELHRPTSRKMYDAARHRLVFDDLLEFQLGLALTRRFRNQGTHARALPTSTKIDSRIRRLFPFSFTDGQDKAIAEVCRDLSTERPMHRLLQADVGAGKTVVAIYAALVCVAAGHQAVLMAPTEVLALQHWETVNRALEQSRVKRLLLTSGLTTSERKAALADIEQGEIDLIIGTQAIIQKDVKFHQLGLVVIDEQHKFGVLQRAKFSSEEILPHVLVMTATPIPRSLCLTQFGDLDITEIRELPPGRQRVVTSRVSGENAKLRAWDFVCQQLETGRQAYVVCPRIEEQDEQQNGSGQRVAAAEQVYRELSEHRLRDYTVGLLHGQMNRQAKAEIMNSFRNGDIQVLVSTTVVEVGVDVPNATLMAILQAESYGLSQLHQLRGRISRGKFQGYCFLFSESESEEGVRRLETLEESSDGFHVAEVDFELRGPGNVLGTAQHGQLPLRVADLVRDHGVLNKARKVAFELVDSGEIDEPQFTPLKIQVLERFARLMDLPQSG